MSDSGARSDTRARGRRVGLARFAVSLVAVVTAGSAACSGQSHAGGTTMSGHRGPAARAPGAIVPPAPVLSSTATGSRGSAPLVRRRVLFGRSVLGVPLVVDVHGAAAPAHRLLVVGCIHGDEGAAITIARALDVQPAPAGVQMWVVDDLNPDGFRLHTRQNADHVALNRNFPYAWAPLGLPGDQQYSGPQPLSEPEARAAAGLIEMVRPDVTIWFHQPLNVVDDSGGAQNVERRFAALAGMRFRRLARYPGSAASWQNHAQRGSTAFVVELPRPTPAATAGRLATAVDELFAVRRPSR